MLQRVQSLFLLAVVLCMLFSLLFPVWNKINPENEVLIEIYGLYSKQTQPGGEIRQEIFPFALIGGFVIVAAIIAFVEIFQFKNRLNQIKMGALNSLIMSSVLGLSLYLSFQEEKIFVPQIQGQYGLGLFLPCIALIFNVLANRFIRRDEKLVRSVDRIR
ncbi:MAG: DUF4293 domain-containing protein [Bacteroidetes bacterium]|nr:DUF4293 domain-containing protein [Bacteroidota bacterium]MCZ6899284.1 DUF4293 domain-containing protein [Bacteroidota bacterium]